MSDENKKTERRLLPVGRRRNRTSQIELSDVTKKEKYDVWAALAEALLVFMISYGSVGGFLNAYEIKYNWSLCLFSLLGLALITSFIYETGKKWFTNLCVIGIFIIYAYVAFREFWILNSGAYAVINEIYEAAQNYLGISGTGLYNLQVDDSYRTVTAIALFVGVVIIILMVIRLQYKASLIRTLLLTFTLYLVPIYFEKTPDQLSLFMMLSGYLTIWLVQRGRVKTHLSAQFKQMLPAGMIIAAAIVLFFGITLPKNRYRVMVPKNPSKEATEEAAVTYAQYGIMALFMNGVSSGGLNEGRLSQNTMMVTTDETDLIVRFTPYSTGTTYLKAFTGLDYDGQRWSKATDVFGETEGQMLVTMAGRRAAYQEDSQVQPRGVMEVFHVGANLNYEFQPYYTDGGKTERIPSGEFPEEAKRGMRYVYYPKVGEEAVPGASGEQGSIHYLTVPKICKSAVDDACKRAGLHGTPAEIAEQLEAFFEDEYAYTLRPGYYFGGMDYISYFLSKNKKGYCTHFASAGTMMLRNVGIPARYVEGYVFSYGDVLTEGELVDGASYEDYYDGYSPLGDTALMELEIPDGQAHAWIEMYVEDQGWVVVDVTPAASEEEETGSFWESILGAGYQGAQSGQEQQEMTKYIENALAGGVGVLIALAAAVAIFFLARWGLVRRRESKLPGRERVKLEYGRLTKYLKDRDEGFLKLTTPKEELAWMQEHYKAVMPEGLCEELYATFFAPERERDYGELLGQLSKLKKDVRKVRHGGK